MTDDRDFAHAKLIYGRACWQYMDSLRKGAPDETWLELANAIFAKWPDVDPFGLKADSASSTKSEDTP